MRIAWNTHTHTHTHVDPRSHGHLVHQALTHRLVVTPKQLLEVLVGLALGAIVLATVSPALLLPDVAQERDVVGRDKGCNAVRTVSSTADMHRATHTHTH